MPISAVGTLRGTRSRHCCPTASSRRITVFHAPQLLTGAGRRPTRAGRQRLPARLADSGVVKPDFAVASFPRRAVRPSSTTTRRAGTSCSWPAGEAGEHVSSPSRGDAVHC